MKWLLEKSCLSGIRCYEKHKIHSICKTPFLFSYKTWSSVHLFHVCSFYFLFFSSYPQNLSSQFWTLPSKIFVQRPRTSEAMRTNFQSDLLIFFFFISSLSLQLSVYSPWSPASAPSSPSLTSLYWVHIRRDDLITGYDTMDRWPLHTQADQKQTHIQFDENRLDAAQKLHGDLVPAVWL